MSGFPFFKPLNMRADRRGVAPLFTGVAGGKAMSNCSGLKYGPNETRLLPVPLAIFAATCLIGVAISPSVFGKPVSSISVCFSASASL